MLKSIAVTEEEETPITSLSPDLSQLAYIDLLGLNRLTEYQTPQ